MIRITPKTHELRTSFVLPDYVLCPVLDNLLVNQVERVTEAQERVSRTDRRGRQARLMPLPAMAAGSIKEIILGTGLACPFRTGKCRGQCGFNLRPGHTISQHRQGMFKVNYLVESGAEEVVSHGVCYGLISLRSQHRLFQFYYDFPMSQFR